MKRKLVASIASRFAFAAVLILSSLMMPYMSATTVEEETVCSLPRAAGNWSLTDSGTIISPPLGQRVAVGRFTLTVDGNLTNGVATSSLNGTIANETFYGTYSVNPDCTGTINVKIFSSGTELFDVTLNIAFDKNMHELRGLFTSVVTPGGTALSSVVALDAARQ